MTIKSLENLIELAGSPINLLRAHKFDRPNGPVAYETVNAIPNVPGEFSSWERESRAWREGVALFDLTHHMTGVLVDGPDAQKLLGYLSCNSLFKSTPNKASQIVCVDERGFMVGDGIVNHLDENRFDIFGGPLVPFWVKYHVEKSDLNVTAKIDDRSLDYANGKINNRNYFRYQLQGPLAGQLIEKLNGGPLGDVKFFGMTEIEIAGRHCRALRHGMAGAIGLEIWGPWEEREAVRTAILEAGQEFGLALVGGMAYLVPAIESGWFQSVVSAFYDGESNLGFREWLPADNHINMRGMQGSKVYSDISGYYRTPYDLSYGNFINFDHEFIGRDALKAMDPASAKKKVTLAWETESATELFRQMCTPGGKNVKFLHLPVNCDKIGSHYDGLTIGGRDAGISAWTAYSANERTVLSMALVNPDVQLGDEVVIEWGEAGGGYGDNVTPATDIQEIRAVVSSAPYSRFAAEEYRK